MKLLATETETCVIDRVTLIAPTKVSLPCTLPPENKTWNLHGATLECSQRGEPARFHGATTPPWKRTKMHGTAYRFHEGDAADGTSFVLKLHQHDQTRKRPYHKTIPVVFASRLLQIGDNQGSNANDVRNDVDQMWHTQVVGQDGLFQSGTGGHPIPRLSAL